jgi:hypothetical protein
MRVVCATCHREERWSSEGEGSTALPRVEVVAEGGVRRPAVHPQWERGRTALRSFTGDSGPVVGVCEGCGQLLVGDDRAWPRMEVRIDSEQGPLVVGEKLQTSAGPVGVEEAEAWLRARFEEPWALSVLGQLGRTSMLLFLLPIAMLWGMGALFVLSFFAALWQGPAAPVSGTIDW